MNKKIFMAVVLVFSLMLTLCACGGGSEPAPEANQPSGDATTTTTTAPEATAPTAPTPADGQVLYTVKVLDKDGNPAAGVMVQICKDTCLPGATNAEGIAYFCMPEDEYKVAFTEQPEIYYYFEAGSREMSLVYDLSAPAEDEPNTNDVELVWPE